MTITTARTDLRLGSHTEVAGGFAHTVICDTKDCGARLFYSTFDNDQDATPRRSGWSISHRPSGIYHRCARCTARLSGPTGPGVLRQERENA